MDSRRRMMARSASSSAIWSSRCLMSSNSPAIDCLVDQLDGMAHVDPGGGQEHRAAWVGGGHHGGAGAPDGLDLAFPDGQRHVGMLRTVGAAGAATQSLVVELGRGHIGRQNSAHVLMRLLHMPEMARIVDRNGERKARLRREPR